MLFTEIEHTRPRLELGSVCEGKGLLLAKTGQTFPSLEGLPCPRHVQTAVERQLKTLNNFLPLNQWSNLAVYVASGTVGGYCPREIAPSSLQLNWSCPPLARSSDEDQVGSPKIKGDVSSKDRKHPEGCKLGFFIWVSFSRTLRVLLISCGVSWEARRNFHGCSKA